MARPRGLGILDAAALGAVALWCVWVVASSVWNGRVPQLGGTYIVAPVVLVAGVVLGRVAARTPQGPLADALLLFPLVALLPGVALRMAPGPPPLGYANSNTAAATQVMVLLALAALDRSRDRWNRAILWVAVGVAAWAVVHHGSRAGIVVAVPVALIVLLTLTRPPRHRWCALVLGAGSLAAAVVVFLWLASRPTWPDAVLRAFDPVRRVMWQEALKLWAAHPVAGGGPGSFLEVNPYGHDTDTMAAHSSLLQTGSELGLVGVALLAQLVGLVFALACRGTAPRAVLGIVAWTALWIHSLVDHLFDYPGLVLLAGVVLGWAGAVRRAPRPPGSAPIPEAPGARTPAGGS